MAGPGAELYPVTDFGINGVEQFSATTGLVSHFEHWNGVSRLMNQVDHRVISLEYKSCVF